MIEDAILDVLELSDETYTKESMAEYVGGELDEDAAYVMQIIDEMVEDGRLIIKDNGDITVVEE